MLGVSLNAPYGARCFLTARTGDIAERDQNRLNAPYGARCFLTVKTATKTKIEFRKVLMHLMALGAF